MTTQPAATPPSAAAAAPAYPTTALEIPDWGNQTSVFQTRQPAFWFLAAVLGVTGIIWLARELELLQVAPTAWLLSIALLALYAVPVFAAIYFLDLFEREPISLLAAALIWGGVVSIALAAPTNTAWLEILQKIFGPQFAAEWGPALIGPAVEELLKFLGIVTIWLIARSEIDDVFDGFVYGALIGLGFAIIENLHYFLRFVANAGAGGEFGAVLQGFFIRVIASGPYTHVLFTAIAGMGFAYFLTRLDQPRQRRLLFAIGGFALAVFAHFIWNSPLLGFLLGDDPGLVNWILYAAVKGLPFFVFLVLMVRLASTREQRWFERAVAGHVGGDALSAEDVKILSDIRTRRRARKDMGRRKGPEGERLAGRLQSAQLSLAMIATRTGTTQADLDRQLDYIRGIRADLAKLPDVPAAIVPTTGAAVAAARTAGTAPATPPLPAAVPWAPTHLAPPGGLQSWDQPDASRPMTPLAAGLELVVVQRIGDWAQVRAVNGWSGWVDARRLVAKS